MIPYSEFQPNCLDRKGAFLPDQQNWSVAPAFQSRDSGILERSNFKTLLELLGGESKDVEICNFGHWACGWFKIIILNPENQELIGTAEKIEKQLDEYPILDEDNYSQLENEEMHECWESFACEEFIYKMGKEFNLKDPTVDFLLDLDQNRILEFYLSFANDPYWEEGNGLYFNIEDIVQNQMERKDLVNFIKKMKKNIIKVKEN